MRGKVVSAKQMLGLASQRQVNLKPQVFFRANLHTYPEAGTGLGPMQVS